MSASSSSAAGYSDGSWDYIFSDEIGNLFKTKEKTDRQYRKPSQLLKDVYAERSGSETYTYTYDALGTRLTKTFKEETTNFVWDGNVPLHEWTTSVDESILSVSRTLSGAEMEGELELNIPENLTTWIFEDGTFIPMAKLQGGKSYSIITDHLGTPTESYDDDGKKVWSRQLNIYGETRSETGVENFIPFLYQGQYRDCEAALAYNRFRYYSPESGTYISQDPIGLDGKILNLYSYASDINSQIDPYGLACQGVRSVDDIVKKYGGKKTGKNRFEFEGPGA